MRFVQSAIRSRASRTIRQSAESLAGRNHYHSLGGLSLDEIGTGSLDRRWLRGGFPEAWLARSHAAAFRRSGGVHPQRAAERGEIERDARGVVLHVLHLLQQQFEFGPSGCGARRIARCPPVQGG